MGETRKSDQDDKAGSAIPSSAVFSVYSLALARLITLLTGAFVLLAIGLILYVGMKWHSSPLPFKELRSFAITESSGRELRDIKQLPIDGLSHYAQAACVQAETAKTVRRVLQAQLSKIPEEARKDLVRAAVIERASVSNSVQNTTAGIGSDGRAQHYFAFWSTHYSGSRPLGVPKYSTCVVTAGISLNIGEEVAEWRTTRSRSIIGYTPCKCSWVSCENCPVFNDDMTRTPIFKRHKLTLDQHVQLNRWMVQQAVERAKILTSTHTSVVDKLFGNGDDKLPGIGMRAIDADTFHGSDHKPSISDRTNIRDEL